MAGTTAKELLKALEERAKEMEALKKELQHCQKERNQLESQKHSFDEKQPQDVQHLLCQKRELQMQLEREESEKHELFSQINQLIGEVDDLKNEKNAGTSAIKAQLEELSAENEELKKDFGRKEMAFQNVSDELLRLQAEQERKERTHNLEKNRLREEVHDCQKEIEVKSAALQSMSLAKQGSDDLHKVLSENDSLRQELQEKEDLLKELTETNDELGQSLTESGAEIDTLRQQLSDLTQSQSSAAQGELNGLREQLDASAKDRQELEDEIAKLNDKHQRTEHSTRELMLRVTELEEENDKLQQSASMAEDLGTIINSLKEAKTELSSKETEISKLRHQSRQQQEEIDSLATELNNVKNNSERIKEQNQRQNQVNGYQPCKKCSVAEAEVTQLTSQLQTQVNNVQNADASNHELKSLQAERINLVTQLKSKSDRLEKVEELVQRLEGSLKLIESENSKSKQLEADRVNQIEHLKRQLVEVEDNLRLSRETLQAHSVKETHVVDTLKRELDSERQTLEQKSKELMELQNTEEQSQIFLKRLMNALEIEHFGPIEDAEENLIVQKLVSYKQKSAGFERHLAELDGMKKNKAVDGEALEQLAMQLKEAGERNQSMSKEMEEMKARHNEEQKTMRDEMIENVGRLSGLLESENKRQSATKQEKEHWQEEANKLRQQKLLMQQELEELRRSKLEQEQEAAARPPLQRQSSRSSNEEEGGEGSLKAKVSKLMDENARLAGDLLKQQCGTEHQFHKAIQQEKQSWMMEKSKLEARLKETQQQLEEASKSRKSSNEPIPKPRKLTLNGGESDVLNAINDSSEKEGQLEHPAVAKLRLDLEKQKRLVTVLRKKLQQQGIEVAMKSRTGSTSSSATMSGSATLPRRL